MIDLNDKEVVEQLIDDCIKGKRKSQKLLYEKLYRKMLGVCMRYASNLDDAKDIVHEGFIKVFMRLKSYEGKGSLEGWIRRIIVNTAIDYIRKSKDILIEDDNDIRLQGDIYHEDDETDIAAFTSLRAEYILKLIQKLAPAYKTAFNLYVIENYTHKEIAEMLNISEGTSKSNLAKAKIKLRELYNKNIHELEQ